VPQRLGPLFALALLTFAACHRGGSGSSPAQFQIVDLSPTEGTLTDNLAREVAKARKASLRPFLEVSASWCMPCRRLKAALVDSRMQEALAGTYIIRVDYDAWEKQFAAANLKVAHIPVFFQLSPDGHPTDRTIDGEAWVHDVPEEMAPLLKTFFAQP
jgi:thiol:disulfide interchange protein